MGDSKALISFMQEFVHSQMFERFCDERLKKKSAQNISNPTNIPFPTAATSIKSSRTVNGFASSPTEATTVNGIAFGIGEEDIDLFDSCVAELKVCPLLLSQTR